MPIKVKADIAREPHLRATAPRGVTCHTGSYSVTFHPTQVNAPLLTPAMQAGTWFSYPARTSDLSIASPTPNRCTTKPTTVARPAGFTLESRPCFYKREVSMGVPQTGIIYGLMQFRDTCVMAERPWIWQPPDQLTCELTQLLSAGALRCGWPLLSGRHGWLRQLGRFYLCFQLPTLLKSARLWMLVGWGKLQLCLFADNSYVLFRCADLL